MNVFYERLKKLLEQNHISRNSFSAQTGIPIGTIRMWQRGSIPSVALALKVAKFFNVPVEWLAGDEPKKGENEPVMLNDDEKELLHMYRSVDLRDKKAIRIVAEGVYSEYSVTTEKTTTIG